VNSQACKIAPAVSVIIPTYNARAFAGRAIESALEQRCDLELLVIDDASQDGTAEVIDRAYRKSGRLRLLRLDRNCGPARARNVGIAAARGEWIALLDADDAWRPHRLERLLAKAADADAVFDNLIGYDAESKTEGGPLFPSFPPGGLNMADLLAPRRSQSQYDLGYLKPIVRRDFLAAHWIAYDERLRSGEDLLFYLTMLLEGARTRVIDEALYIYTTPVSHRDGKASPLSRTRPHDHDMIEALERLLARYRSRMTPEATKLVGERITFLRRIAPISEFYFARRTHDYVRMALLLARHPSVQREALGKALRRFSR
jgi:succinoglycan biosynthesis protein ExoO